MVASQELHSDELEAVLSSSPSTLVMIHLKFH